MAVKEALLFYSKAIQWIDFYAEANSHRPDGPRIKSFFAIKSLVSNATLGSFLCFFG